jgi:hypothetical protein
MKKKIDWILASQPLISFISNIETHPPMGLLSEHKPLKFEVPFGAEPKPTSPRLSFNFQAANWPEFRNKFNLNQWNNSRPLNSTSDIEDYTSFITDSITSAARASIPLSKQINTSYTSSETAKRLIKLKQQTYRRWKKSGEDIEKKKFYLSKILLSKSLRNDRKNNFNKLMVSLCQKKMS